MLVFTAHFWPHVGGVERHALELWSRLVSRGWEVRLVTADTEGAKSRERIRGIDVVRLPTLNLMQRRMPAPIPSAVLLETVRELAAHRPDAIVTNTRFFPSSMLGQLLARLFSLPTLHIEHGSGYAVTGSRLGDGIAIAVDRTLGAAVLRGATRCVGVSGAVVEFVRELGREDAGVLYNGVDTNSFAADGDFERSALGIPAHAPLVLFIGRLFADKGVLSLWDAFEHVAQSHGAHLVLAGDGPLTSELRERARGRPDVHMLGFVASSRVPALLAASDVVAHPSACAEGMPSVVLEAAAAGRAILATTVGGTPEIIEHQRSGLLLAPRDEVALREGLQRLCADAALRARLGSAARARCHKLFDWERIADLTEIELHKLTASRRPAGLPIG